MSFLLATYLYYLSPIPSCDSVNHDLLRYSCIYTDHSGQYVCDVDNSDKIGNRPNGLTPFEPQSCRLYQ
jgi:hypothetical protein